MVVVYLVGEHGAEHNMVLSIHRTHGGALRVWEAHRLELLKKANEWLVASETGRVMHARIVRNLSCENPEKMDNYPHETPYIEEYELQN